METKDRKRALEAIGMMLAGFPSSQSAISEITAESYLLAVSNCTISAIEATCAAFLQGQVTGHNNDFPPTAPRLASLALALGDAARSLADGPRLISYRMGEAPPAGTVPLGAVEDGWRGKTRTKLLSQK